MKSPRESIMEKKAKAICQALEKRFMGGLYVDNKEDACKTILNMIPEKSLVGLGGSVTLLETGLLDELRKKDIELIDRYRKDITPEEMEGMRQKGLQSDVFISSFNAITLKGQIINCDGMGNRVAAILYGPKKVILVGGVNKIVNTVDEGVNRVHSIAAPMNCIRFKAKTPCSATGIHDDAHCFPPSRLCNCFTIIHGQLQRGRINVVLIGEDYGF
jgi:L-lactate utilization protein LutB